MYCQVCGAFNGDEVEFCERCRSHLLILSGNDQGDDFFGSLPLEEHLLERLTALEDKVLRMEEALYVILQSIHSQDQSLLVGQAGLQTVREILEEKGLVESDIFIQAWEERLNRQVLSRERAETVEERIEIMKSQFSGNDREEFVSRLKEAARLFHGMDDERGYEMLVRALKLDKDNVELLVLLGELNVLDGHQKAARRFLGMALKMDGKHFSANFHIALVNFYDRKLNEAERYLNVCLENNKNPFLVHFTLGMLRYQQKDLAGAEDAFVIASIEKIHPQASMMLGTVLYEAGKVSEAIKPLREALSFEPENDEAHFLLGLCYLERNWTKKAESEFQEALRTNPGRLQFQQALLMSHVWKQLSGIPESSKAGHLCHQADELIAAGHVDRALHLFKKAMEHEPENSSIAVGYTVAALQAQQYPLVLKMGYRLLRRDLPEVLAVPVYAALLFACRGLEKHQEGVRYAREMAKLSKMDYARTIADMELAYHLAQLGKDLDEAYSKAREALKNAPEELIGECYDTLGWVSFKLGKHQEAHRNLKKSVKLQPNPHNLLRLGMVCLHLGKREEARHSFQDARQNKSRSTDLHRYLWDHLKNGLRRKGQ